MSGDRQAASILDRFENRYAELRSHTLQTEAAMRFDNPNEGRNPLAGRTSDIVNGSEVRGSERWLRTGPRVKSEGRRITVDPETLQECGTSTATLCALLEGRRWEPLPTPERATRKPKPKPIDANAEFQATLRAIANGADMDRRETIAAGIA